MAVSVLVTGDFAWDIYERDFGEGLRSAGADVVELPVLSYFGASRASRSLQRNLLLGPGPWLANRALLRACRRVRPSVILAWRTAWLRPSTIQACQQLGARLVLYNNDDPFGPDRGSRTWRLFRRLVPYADACFAYRAVNLEDFALAGARRVALLRSWFNPKIHHPVILSGGERKVLSTDCVFVGHAENDGRLDLLRRLDAAGLDVRVHGTGWDSLLRGSLQKLVPVRRLDGLAYTRAVVGAKIGLVFLSARNRDQYTRRCFEIPAIGTMMLAPRTVELRTLYQEGKEMAAFSTPSEFVDLAVRYCRNDQARRDIAEAGHRRCLADGNDVVSRGRQFLRDLSAMFPELRLT